jgi:hypothetical protein
MVEHACQQRLLVKCCNRNNGINPLTGTIVVASAPEVDDGLSTCMSTRGAKRQRCTEHEDNVTFDDVDDFGLIVPSPSGDIDPMEADLHSGGSISAFHKFEVAAYGNHGMPLGTAISLRVDDVLARMSPNTCTEDALLDLYLILSKAG